MLTFSLGLYQWASREVAAALPEYQGLKGVGKKGCGEGIVGCLLKRMFWVGFTGFLPRCMKCRRGLAMRILSVCPSVRPSVCLSVTHVIPDKTEERSVQIFIQYERTFILVF